MTKPLPLNHSVPIVLFDGVCNLCNASVDLILKYDKKKTMKFASLQSNIGAQLILKYKLNQIGLTTIVFIDSGKAYTHSTAILKIAGHMGGLWPAAAIFFIFPKFFRDYIYKIISKNRYRWFGKRDTCRLPSSAERKRFIE